MNYPLGEKTERKMYTGELEANEKNRGKLQGIEQNDLQNCYSDAGGRTQSSRFEIFRGLTSADM
jgi:hypothetical protein